MSNPEKSLVSKKDEQKMQEAALQELEDKWLNALIEYDATSLKDEARAEYFQPIFDQLRFEALKLGLAEKDRLALVKRASARKSRKAGS